MVNGTIISIKKDPSDGYGRDKQVVLFDDGTIDSYTVGTFYAARGAQVGDRVRSNDIGWQTAIDVDIVDSHKFLSKKQW